MLSIGDTVKVHYTGKYANGNVFDSTAASEPILFTIGDDLMIPAFEEAVMSMKEGDIKIIDLKAADAYGDYDEDLLMDVNRAEVFGDKEIKKGDTIQAPTDEGVMVFKVHKVGEEKVILDGNSEMAGKDVVFEIELLNVMKGDGELADFEDSDDEFDVDEDFDVEDY